MGSHADGDRPSPPQVCRIEYGDERGSPVGDNDQPLSKRCHPRLRVRIFHAHVDSQRGRSVSGYGQSDDRNQNQNSHITYLAQSSHRLPALFVIRSTVPGTWPEGLVTPCRNLGATRKPAGMLF